MAAAFPPPLFSYQHERKRLGEIPGTERKMEMRSDKVTKGVERAPMRSLFYAMGYTKEELERPLIGVVSAKSEIVPGHMHLDKVADRKSGV